MPAHGKCGSRVSGVGVGGDDGGPWDDVSDGHSVEHVAGTGDVVGLRVEVEDGGGNVRVRREAECDGELVEGEAKGEEAAAGGGELEEGGDGVGVRSEEELVDARLDSGGGRD